MDDEEPIVDTETARRAMHKAIEQLRQAGLNASPLPNPVAPAVRGVQVGPWHPSPGLMGRDDYEAKTYTHVVDGRVKVSWSQAICSGCYDKRYPQRPPVKFKSARREQCCDCGMPTDEGIYMREDPMTVRFPRVVRDE